MSATIVNTVSRRNFLKTGAVGATGLVIGFYLPGRNEALAATPVAKADLNAWIHIGTDDIVTITIDKSEMGQGVITALSQLAAEELECNWKNIRNEFALAEKVYYNPLFGMQGTGGSSSIRASWTPMRKAGATAREMLVSAAAQKWGVDKSECHAENGAVVHAASKRRATYGSLAAAASKLTPPADVTLKDPKDFKVIGKPQKRLDTPAKVSGRAAFGIDTRRPGMLYAAVARCPVFGGKVASFDPTKAKAIVGVKGVYQISSGVAVVANNTWTAMQGRNSLDIKWDEGHNANLNGAAIRQMFIDGADKGGVAARKEGDVAKGMAAAAQKIQAVYEAPYAAHATMEPMNCTADVRADRCEIWAPTQFQTVSQATAAGFLKLQPEQVVVHTTFLGGGFGRRAGTDFIMDAVETSKAAGAPVKVTWSRDNDMQHDYYRPASYCRFSAGIGADGWPVAFSSTIASPSILKGFMGAPVADGLDETSTEGVSDMRYAIPNVLVNYQLTDPSIPVGFLRSVGNSQNGFFMESFVDEMAHAAGKDPYEFRKKLLANEPRHLGVLNLAAEKAGWGKPLPAGRFRGIAVMRPFNTYCAQVAEVSVDKAKGAVKVHRVVTAVDCGRVVNPDIVKAQMEGGPVYGLTLALYGEITIDKGRVEQANFDTYKMLRMNEMPVMEVYIVPSEENPTGTGEPGVAPVLPALGNAIFAATGKRIRKLPIRPEDLV